MNNAITIRESHDRRAQQDNQRVTVTAVGLNHLIGDVVAVFRERALMIERQPHALVNRGRLAGSKSFRSIAVSIHFPAIRPSTLHPGANSHLIASSSNLPRTRDIDLLNCCR